jgi:ubiquinone/menaquinone biosynthesis C-methylase UbiE
MADVYDRLIVPTTFAPFAVDLARRVAAHEPKSVLELAAGTGVVTRHLVTLGADVVATDLNNAMVEVGAANVAEARWQQADATNLPFADAEYDVVVCQFGVMFLPDRRAVYSGIRRVLAPGGRFLANTWGPIQGHFFERVFQESLGVVFPTDTPDFLLTTPHGYSDPEVIAGDLRSAGFDDVTVEPVTVQGRADSTADLVLGYCTGTPVRAQLEPRGDLDATVERVTEEVERRLGPGPLTGDMTAMVIDAACKEGARYD